MFYPILQGTVYAPTGADAAASLPLIVYLAPDTGEPPAVLTAGTVPARILYLTCPDGFHWQNLPYEIDDAIEKVKTSHAVDSDRISVIGEGFGVWSYAIFAHKRLSCAVPIAGGGLSWRAHEVKKMPVWAFHGAADSTLNRIHGQEMIERVLLSSGHSHMTLYPERDHAITDEVLSTDAILRWMAARSVTEEFSDEKFTLDPEVTSK